MHQSQLVLETQYNWRTPSRRPGSVPRDAQAVRERGGRYHHLLDENRAAGSQGQAWGMMTSLCGLSASRLIGLRIRPARLNRQPVAKVLAEKFPPPFKGKGKGKGKCALVPFSLPLSLPPLLTPAMQA